MITESFDSTAAHSFAGPTTVIHGDADPSTFHNVTGDQYHAFVNSAQDVRELLATLKPVDRSDSYVPPCMPGTRQDIFEAVDRWLDDVSESNILCIRGSPGSGKSTIASSLVSRITERGQLSANFAFKRENITLRDPTTVWRTIAHDLSRHEAFAQTLVQVLKGPNLHPGRSDIMSDFRYLIKEPFTRSLPHATSIIVIDAVDECSSEGSLAGQRKTFFDTLTEWSSLPGRCKLIVTARDDHIPDTFRAVCKQLTLLTGADVNESVNEDIRRFFEIRIAEFGECLDSEMLVRERVFERLTSRAAGLFIWANTVVRFMDEGIHQERLELVLNGTMGGGDNIIKLYQQFLEFSFPRPDDYMMSVFRHVVGAIVLSKVPLHEDDLPHFTSEQKPSVKSILDNLSTFLSTGAHGRVRISHLSFSEFLCDPSQCPKPFYIDQKVINEELMTACFRLMRDGLRFNICRLETSHLFNWQVEDLSQRIKTNVGSALLYSCRYWAAHLQDTMADEYDRNALTAELEDFLHIRLLFWLEVMSLANEVAVANVSLLKVAQAITVSVSAIVIASRWLTC